MALYGLVPKNLPMFIGDASQMQLKAGFFFEIFYFHEMEIAFRSMTFYTLDIFGTFYYTCMLNYFPKRMSVTKQASHSFGPWSMVHISEESRHDEALIERKKHVQTLL